MFRSAVRSRVAAQVGLGVAYAAAGHVGLLFDPSSVLWPPAGIALAAFLLDGGIRLWPAVFVAGFAVNYSVGTALVPALLLALVNTAESVMAAKFLRYVRLQHALQRLQDVSSFVLASIVIPMAPACFGAMELHAIGRAPDLVLGWTTWWLSSMTGIIVVTTPILVAHARMGIPHARWREVGVCAVTLLACNTLVFLLPTGAPMAPPVLSYLLFPILIWIAVRFGQRGVVPAIVVTAVLAIAGTTMAHGPFASGTRHTSLLGLQMFLAVVFVTLLILGAVIDERQRAIRLRDEFLAIASHELRTPLQALLTASQLLQRATNTADATALLQMMPRKVGIIGRQATSLGRLVDDLLDVSRLRANQLVLQRTPMDLAAVTRAVVSEQEEAAQAVGCAVEVSCAGPVTGLWDERRVWQVVTNLLSNAIKYGQHGRVCIRIETQAGAGRLVIEDHGIGIEAQDLERIFGRFERVADASYSGLGLGLYISQQIVRAHGGQIEVSSQPRRGSVFTVTLPQR